MRRVLFGSLSCDSNMRTVVRPGQDVARGLNGNIQTQVTERKLAGVSLPNEMVLLARARA